MLPKVREKTQTLNKELNERLDTILHDFVRQGESFYNEYGKKIKQLEEVFAQKRQQMKKEILDLEDHKEANSEALLGKYRQLNEINDTFNSRLEELIQKHQKECHSLAENRLDELNQIIKQTNDDIDEFLKEMDEFLKKAEEEALNDFSRAKKLNHSAAEKFKAYLERRIRSYMDEYQKTLQNYRE
jgi:ABC-type transporter Mla subunit MlaD